MHLLCGRAEQSINIEVTHHVLGIQKAHQRIVAHDCFDDANAGNQRGRMLTQLLVLVNGKCNEAKAHYGKDGNDDVRQIDHVLVLLAFRVLLKVLEHRCAEFVHLFQRVVRVRLIRRAHESFLEKTLRML